MLADSRVEKLLNEQPAPRPGSRQRSLRTGDFMVVGPEHRLWALKVDGFDFAEWDGSAWQPRPVPEAVASANLINADFLTDRQGQAWLLPHELDRTAVYDFAAGTWAVFETLREAVAAKLVPGDTLTGAHYSVNLGPTSHANGTKAFIHFDGDVHVYLGGQWHETTLTKIGIRSLAERGMPFFNREGLFCISSGDRLFACKADGRWEQIPPEEPLAVLLRRAGPLSPPREGWGIAGTEIRSFCLDRTGAYWLATSTAGLMKWRDGVSVQLMDRGQTFEVRPDSAFAEVLLDSAGNAFLRRDAYDLVVHYEAIAALPAGALPTARWEPATGGTGTLRVEGPAGGFHRWRLGDGPWSGLGTATAFPITGLLPGTYTAMLECFTMELSAAGPTLTVQFDIAGLTTAQINEQIKLLESPDADIKETAAATLRSQGARALPLLRAASAASPDKEALQWWLRAVMEQIEREAAPK